MQSDILADFVVRDLIIIEPNTETQVIYSLIKLENYFIVLDIPW